MTTLDLTLVIIDSVLALALVALVVFKRGVPNGWTRSVSASAAPSGFSAPHAMFSPHHAPSWSVPGSTRQALSDLVSR